MRVKYEFIPDLVLKYIKEYNLSKREFCNQCGISINALNKFLARDLRIDVKEWLSIANFLKILPLDLLKRINI